MSINKNGYFEGKPEHSDLVSRKIAYKEIYRKNREKYTLFFRNYVVHHIDSEKLNNSVKNLYICTKEEHNAIHKEQKARFKRFANASEIDYFLRSKRAEGQYTLEGKPDINKILSKTKREQEIEKERETKKKEDNIFIVILLVLVILFSFTIIKGEGRLVAFLVLIIVLIIQIVRDIRR